MTDNDNTMPEGILGIMGRTSVRAYDEGRDVTPRQEELMLRAAMAAPTGVNRRPWLFVVVRDRVLLEALAGALPYCKMAARAPMAVVVCGDRSRFLDGDDSTLWVQDVSAASENLLLAAHMLGLGGVWTALYPHADRMEAVKRVLALPDDAVPFNVIPVGYPARVHAPMDKWDPSRILRR